MRRWAGVVTVVVAAAIVASLQVMHDVPAPHEVDVITGTTPITLPVPSPLPLPACAPAAAPEPVAAVTETVVAKTEGTAIALGQSSTVVVEDAGTESVVITNSGTAIATTGGNTGANVSTGPATAVGNRATVDLRP